MKNSVSIIIPMYNAEDTINNTLKSCLLHLDFILEIIIINDFSTDNSYNIALKWQKKYNSIIKIYDNTHKGGNNARNLGFLHSKGSLIQWLDADDELLRNKLRYQIELFDNDPNLDIVYSDWRINRFKLDNRIISHEIKILQNYDDFLEEMLLDNWSVPCNYLFSRRLAEKLDKISAWNPLTNVCQDREYATLAALYGKNFCYCPGILSNYNIFNKESVSKTTESIRLNSINNLLCRFENEIELANNISNQKKKKYQVIINTQKLYLTSRGIYSPILKGNIQFSLIKWSMIHGIRTKIKIILLVILSKLKINKSN